MYLQNEEKYLDLTEWLDTLEELGVNIPDALPTVAAATARVDQLERIGSQHLATRRETSTLAREIANTNLNDTTAVLTLADQLAYAQSDENRERVTEILEAAADIAKGDALRRFRRADIIGALRPGFDTITTRITHTQAQLPEGVLNLDDAARVGHADTWMQLERDITTWKTLSTLISDLTTAGILKPAGTSEHHTVALDFLVENYDAYDTALAGRGSVRAQAAAIVAGQPKLRTPEEITEPSSAQLLTYEEQARRTWEANQHDRDAQKSLAIARPA